MSFQAPNGDEIKGTSETILGAAGVSWSDDAAVDDYDHSGGTEVFWDTSETETIDGAAVFTDDSGVDWLEHHLIPEGFEPLPQAVIAPMQRELVLGRALEQARKLNEAIVIVNANGALVRDIETTLNQLDVQYTEMKKAVLEMRQAELDAQAAREDEDA